MQKQQNFQEIIFNIMKMVKAKLRKGIPRLGWVTYWLVDEKDQLLNTEPICSVPENWHPWFEKILSEITTDYVGFID